MGCNFYLSNPSPKYRLEGARDLHIGKSSAGWAFSLHIIPEIGLNTWADWAKILSRKTAKIVSEEQEYVTFAELEDRILHRAPRTPLTDKTFQPPLTGDKGMWSIVYGGYRNLDDFLRKNHAWQDEDGLLRHNVDHRHCTYNSPVYTYDHILGVFC